MRRPLSAAVLWLGLTASCRASDPWAPCRQAPITFSADAPQCTSPGCRACAARLEEAWRDPARRTELRLNFMRASTDARDRFIATSRPEGPFAYEHCTAATARGASCAMYTPTCVEVFARALRSGDTSVAQRTQMNLAVDRACDAPRRAIVDQLDTCAPDLGRGGCGTGACRACTAGRLAALSLLAPTADQPDRAETFRAFVRETPEVVARAIAEALGAPDAPVDLDPMVVRRGLRAYCVDLLGHSRAALPFACNARVVMLLTHPEFAREFAETWDALRQAPATSIASVFDQVLGVVALQATPASSVLEQMDRLPPAAIVDGYRRAAQRSNLTPGAAAAVRLRLDRIGHLGRVPSADPPPPPPPPSGGTGTAV